MSRTGDAIDMMLIVGALINVSSGVHKLGSLAA